LRPRSTPKTTEKPERLRKADIAKLVAPARDDIDNEAEERQRGGVQSLGRAFAILEEVARHREGVGLADLSKRVALHNSTTFHLARTLVSLGYLRQEKESKRYRIGRPLFALAASALDEIRREQPFRGADRRRHRGDRAHQRCRRIPAHRPRRRGTAGALHGARQDHLGLAAAGPVAAFSRACRAHAID
jgi:hypothetical protein